MKGIKQFIIEISCDQDAKVRGANYIVCVRAYVGACV